MLHSVTLGGTGKAGGDRHPKIRRGVMIGAGAKVLGNIEVGEDARIAAGSVVLEDVPRALHGGRHSGEADRRRRAAKASTPAEEHGSALSSTTGVLESRLRAGAPE